MTHHLHPTVVMSAHRHATAPRRRRPDGAGTGERAVTAVRPPDLAAVDRGAGRPGAAPGAPAALAGPPARARRAAGPRVGPARRAGGRAPPTPPCPVWAVDRGPRRRYRAGRRRPRRRSTCGSDDAADAYLSTSTRPEGRTLARAVRAGELLPRAALEEADRARAARAARAGGVRAARAWSGASSSTSTRWPIRPPAPPAWPTAASTLGGARGARCRRVSGRSDGVLSTPTTASRSSSRCRPTTPPTCSAPSADARWSSSSTTRSDAAPVRPVATPAAGPTG